MKAILMHLAATGPLDPAVHIDYLGDNADVAMLGFDQTRYPYRGLLRMSLRVDPVEHADHARRAGGWQQIDTLDYDDEELGRLVRSHLNTLVDAGARHATVVISLVPDTP